MISNFTLSIGLLVSAACGGLPLENGPELQRDALQNVFSSSGFAERFAESYLAENDVVPAVSADEQMVVQEVQQLLSEGINRVVIHKTPVVRTQVLTQLCSVIGSLTKMFANL